MRKETDLSQRRKAYSSTEQKLSGLTSEVDEADSGIFSPFCKRIKVANIREYEDVQLKIAQEENEAMEAFASQHARVGHQ